MCDVCVMLSVAACQTKASLWSRGWKFTTASACRLSKWLYATRESEIKQQADELVVISGIFSAKIHRYLSWPCSSHCLLSWGSLDDIWMGNACSLTTAAPNPAPPLSIRFIKPMCLRLELRFSSFHFHFPLVCRRPGLRPGFLFATGRGRALSVLPAAPRSLPGPLSPRRALCPLLALPLPAHSSQEQPVPAFYLRKINLKSTKSSRKVSARCRYFHPAAPAPPGEPSLQHLGASLGHNLQIPAATCAMPCCAKPCRAVLCRAELCQTVPCRVEPCRAEPCCAEPRQTVPSRAVLRPCRTVPRGAAPN
ncbi:uncharacterized protein LOC121074582 [Cygnus olor]|uniref:uncharacterized protein LOC121074582 n=1 Tax=Cygnus olor TaxID=8869 RepID=UPI001ADE50BA|nr:uncharacterized protein LOC121074582 [Cygnus olor]